MIPFQSLLNARDPLVIGVVDKFFSDLVLVTMDFTTGYSFLRFRLGKYVSTTGHSLPHTFDKRRNVQRRVGSLRSMLMSYTNGISVAPCVAWLRFSISFGDASPKLISGVLTDNSKRSIVHRIFTLFLD